MLPALLAAGGASQNFYTAIRQNDLARLKQLIAKISDIDVKDRHGTTPLLYAAVVGSVDAVRMLLGVGADVNATTRTGATALLWSVSNPDKTRLLLKAGAKVDARTKQGRTPLLSAAWIPGSAPVIRLLLSKGADPKAIDASGNTALIAAAATGDLDVVRLFAGTGLEVNAANKTGGDTALTASAGGRTTTLIKLLLALGADVNVATTSFGTARHGPLALDRLTPLMFAAPYGSPEVVRTLIDAGADVNAKDIRGMTPLMLAVASENQDPEVVRILLEHGADASVMSKDRETALDWAEKFGQPSVLRLLRRSDPQPPQSADVPAAAGETDIRSAIAKSLTLLQRSSAEFFRESGCISCHHQDVTAMALDAAREHGIPVDERAAAEQLRTMKYRWFGKEDDLLAGPSALTDVDTEVYSLFGLAAAKYPPDAMTDAMAVRIARHQRTQGYWGLASAVSRSPIQESDITRTAMSIRMLRVYGPPALKPEFDKRIARARAWLLEVKPKTTDELAMRLLGLSWSNAPPRAVRGAAASLIAAQGDDGGWAPNANLRSDAYATGEALYALCESRTAGPADELYRRAIQFLLRTQRPDGSWYVKSRAPKFQPYFESGFPYGHDQWISAAATAWATIALCSALEPVGYRR